MATARRNYFLVADKVQHEAWTNDQLAMIIRLMAHLHERWARDGRTAEEAGKCVLGKADAMRISGKHRPDIASMSLRCLADVASISVRCCGDVVEIDWPKFAEFQGMATRNRPEADPKPALSDSDSDTDKEYIQERRARRGQNKAPGTQFEKFWLAYPHKVGKGAAEKAFVTATRKVEVSVLLAALARYREDKPHDRQWCNPATWLNQERWLDEPAPSNGNGNAHSSGAQSEWDDLPRVYACTNPACHDPPETRAHPTRHCPYLAAEAVQA